MILIKNIKTNLIIIVIYNKYELNIPIKQCLLHYQNLVDLGCSDCVDKALLITLSLSSISQVSPVSPLCIIDPLTCGGVRDRNCCMGISLSLNPQ